jgi:tetratricopeptide (TPR) repeat protein
MKSHITIILFVLALVTAGPAYAADPLKEADAKLAAGDAKAALDLYQSALTSEPRNVAALCGAASAHRTLGQSPKAIAMLERAISAAPKDRTVVHNLAMLLFDSGAQPRAIKLVRDYLVATHKPADEPMLDTLLYLLGTASDETKKLKLHAEAQATAKQYAQSLEAQRPGYRRWGGEWVDPKVVREFERELEAANKEIVKAAQQIKADDEAIRMLEARKPKLEYRLARGLEEPSARDELLEKIDEAKKTKAAHVTHRTTLIAQLPRPPVPAVPEWIAYGQAAPALSSPQKDETAEAPPRPDPSDLERVETTMPESPGEPPVEAPKKQTTAYGVAFAVSEDTLVVSRALVDGAVELSVQSPSGESEVCEVTRSDALSGLAILKLKTLKASPLLMAGEFNGGAVQCVAVPSPELFRVNAAVIEGDAPVPVDAWTVKLDQNPRLPGAPLIAGGKIVGVTLADRDTDPAAVPAVSLKALRELIGKPAGGKPATDPKQAIFQVLATRELPAE